MCLQAGVSSKIPAVTFADQVSVVLASGYANLEAQRARRGTSRMKGGGTTAIRFSVMHVSLDLVSHLILMSNRWLTSLMGMLSSGWRR